MKKLKMLIALVIISAIVFIPLSAIASETIVDKSDFSEWEGDTPEGWQFETSSGSLSQQDGGAALTIEEDGYAFLSKQITLEAESAYKISVPTFAKNVWGSDVGVNVNFKYQYADVRQLYGTEHKTLELYVKTNVDEQQDYILRVGLGNENEPVNGTALIKGVTITKLDEIPDSVQAYSLIGSIGLTGYSQNENLSDNSGSASTATYNDIGIVLFFVLFVLAIYLLYTSKWSGRFFARISGSCGVILIFTAAFLLRAYLSSRFEGHMTDLNNFKSWAVNLYDTGLSGFYQSGIYSEHPPVYMYVLYCIGWAVNALGLDFYSNSFTFLIKLPSILCDLGLAVFAYIFISKRKCRKLGMGAALFILISPAVITDSMAWGQIDSILALMAAAIAYCIYKGRKTAAASIAMLSVLTTSEAVIFVPVVAVVLIGDLFKKGKMLSALKDIALSAAAATAVYTIIVLPMRGSQSFFYALNIVSASLSQYGYASMNAFNLWGLLGLNYVSSSDMFLGISYSVWGALLTLISTAALFVWYIKKRDKQDVFLMMGLYCLAVFMLSCNMKERYSYAAVMLLIFAAFEKDSKRLFLCTAGLSALLYANLYIVIIFRSELIYSGITIALSAVYFVIFGCTVFVCLKERLCSLSAKPIFALSDEQIPPFKISAENAATKRLSLSPDPARKMCGKDWAIAAAVTAVYGIAALLNLGSLVIPQESPVIEETQQYQATIDLGDIYSIGQMKYYTGYCEGKFSVTVSDDGINFYSVEEPEREHAYADMFRWQMVNINRKARYISIQKTSGYLELRETAFFDEENHILPAVSAVASDDYSTSDALYLIDEQDQAPEATSYMTEMYFDEIYHARTAYEYLNDIYPYEITHPPFGKSIITVGIRLFGMNPYGWRFMGALCGVLMLPILYIFAKRVFKKTLWASIATILFAADFMHYALTRIATIDSYTLFFILLMYLFMYEYTQHNFFNEKLWKTLIPLGLCGISFAFGAATKWICLYAGAGLAIIFFYTVYQRTREYYVLKASGDARAMLYKKNTAITLAFCVAVFIMIPVAVYCASYLPYENSSPAVFGLSGVINNQKYMFEYHGYLKTEQPHPYSSSVFSWPFDIRPVYFFASDGLPGNMRAVIWCMGNPILWWGAVAAVLYLIEKRNARGKKHIELSGLPFVAVAALCQFLPNVLITREMFIYHYFTLVPFLIMIIVFVLKYIYDNYRYGKALTICFTIACCIMFAAFYPVITGIPISYTAGRLLQWLKTWPL